MGRAHVDGSRTTTNTHGWRFSRSGAWVAASSIASRSARRDGLRRCTARHARWPMNRSSTPGSSAVVAEERVPSRGAGPYGPGRETTRGNIAAPGRLACPR